MTRDDLIERLHDLLDGRLDEAAAAEVRAQLLRDAEAARHLRELEQVVTGLAGLRAERAPAGFDQRVLDALGTAPPAGGGGTPSPHLPRTFHWITAVAAVGLALAAGWLLRQDTLPPAGERTMAAVPADEPVRKELEPATAAGEKLHAPAPEGAPVEAEAPPPGSAHEALKRLRQQTEVPAPGSDAGPAPTATPVGRAAGAARPPEAANPRPDPKVAEDDDEDAGHLESKGEGSGAARTEADLQLGAPAKPTISAGPFGRALDSLALLGEPVGPGDERVSWQASDLTSAPELKDGLVQTVAMETRAPMLRILRVAPRGDAEDRRAVLRDDASKAAAPSSEDFLSALPSALREPVRRLIEQAGPRVRIVETDAGGYADLIRQAGENGKVAALSAVPNPGLALDAAHDAADARSNAPVPTVWRWTPLTTPHETAGHEDQGRAGEAPAAKAARDATRGHTTGVQRPERFLILLFEEDAPQR